MKIRIGYVSNSSSCSFCIYGILTNESKIQEITDSVMGEKTMYWADYLNEECAKYDIAWYHPYDSDAVYVGIQWPCIGLDETGQQFIDRTEKNVNQILPNHGEEFETLEEAWYDG